MTPSRWLPSNEQSLLVAIAAGNVEETHHFDAKRQLGHTKGERRDTARDLASFSVDGGTLLIGLEENKPERTWSPHPVRLNGLAEAVEQIGTQVVDPPLLMICREIPSDRDATTGYLLVTIPPSPTAPHMVDGVYWARGERTRIRLSDTEVLRLHVRRRSTTDLLGELLDEEITRDPAAEGTGGFDLGRIYGVAQPLTAPPSAGRTLIRGPAENIYRIVRDIEPWIPQEVRNAAPGPGYLSHFQRRARGLGYASGVTSGAGRRMSTEGYARPETSLVDLEIRDDGGLRLVVGRATDRRSDEDSLLILDALIVAYAARLALWAKVVAEEIGYRGAWGFGIHVTGLRGLRSSQSGPFADERPAYDAEVYREVCVASGLEITARAGEVAERLAGRLTWALGTDKRYPLSTMNSSD